MSLADARHAAAAVTRRHARSFYFSSFPLPRERREGAYAVYAFCRHCDDEIDRAAAGTDLAAAAAALRGLTDRLFGADSVASPAWAPAFQDAIRRFGIPKQCCLDLIVGVEMDSRGAVRLASWPELDRYCYHVASVVGLMMACVFGLRDERGRAQAAALGTAMQLTNILRDVHEDFLMDRIYLPADELEAARVRPGPGGFDFAAPEWKRYAAEFAARARRFYAEAEPGIALLAPGGPQYAVWCMRTIYAAILDEIEKCGWDVSVRRGTTFLQKIGLACKAWRACAGRPSPA